MPSREVLLGALVENTIEEAMFTLESGYGYVKDEITNTAAASKLSFEARLNENPRSEDTHDGSRSGFQQGERYLYGSVCTEA